MSKLSKIIEYNLKRGHRSYVDDKDEADKHLKKRSLEEDEIYKIPKMIYRTKVKSKDIFDCQMIVFNESEDVEHTIIYIHGGAYVNEIRRPHIYFCDKIAKEVNACVFAPIYPLAPNHTYEETYKIVEELYRFALDIGKPITVMGDSAGGGFSAAFCQYLLEKQLPQPDHLILISPWVDVTMSGDYGEYAKKDPMLGIDGLREIGASWAGDLNPKDYRISPMFGDMSGLPETTLFVGTHEILYPDIVNFYEKLIENDVNARLFVGDEMTHVYPIYPLVPESKEAFKEIVGIIIS